MGVLLPHHPIARSDKLHWPRWQMTIPGKLKDQLTDFQGDPLGTELGRLRRVADFLKTQDLKDRDLICWHDSTHPLYVWLQIKPGSVTLTSSRR